ncbi:MAG: reverse transcriptase N-terminal domain-containing protein, partial [Ruminococcus sp.]|nr:reverse transcriptase N-terminal domain-containing protein [Ruminococcus sp.]
LQFRIAKATLENKQNTVKRLQYLLTHSFYAKLIAVKRVTTNKGKRTASVDGVLWKTADRLGRFARALRAASQRTCACESGNAEICRQLFRCWQRSQQPCRSGIRNR